MKKTKLLANPDFDFKIIGLVSNAKGHKLAWEINSSLTINLEKDNDIILSFVEERRLVLLCFKYETENGKLLLIKNRSLESDEFSPLYWIPELRKFDYLIWLRETDLINEEKTVERLKDIRVVQYCVSIDIDKLKSKDNLLF